MTFIERLGAHVAQCGAPPAPLRDLLERHLVDTLGAWLAALRIPEGAALLRWRRALADGVAGASGAAGDAVGGVSASGAGATYRLRLDVMTHCALARLAEIDDIHLATTTTPGAIVIPGALAVAAAFGVGVRDQAASSLAAAMMTGYDVMTRLGQAIDGAAALSRGIWPTYFTAPAAIAAVTARLTGLDAASTAHALGLALVRASPGVGRHNATTTSRWLAIGQAAETGLVAALAARAGFTCDLALLDSGFLPGIYGIKPDVAALSVGLDEDLTPGQGRALEKVSFKPWCAARQTMAATQALTEILAAGVSPDAITRLKAFVPPVHHRMVDHRVAIGDRSSFLTSLPYRLAVAALDPRASFFAVAAAQQVAENIAAFMARIEVVPLAPDDPLMADFPRHWPARIEAMTAAGRHQRIIMHVPGDPQRPFDAAAVQEKFHRFAAPAVGPEAAAQILQRALGLLTGRTSAAALMRDVEDIIGGVEQRG